MVFQVLATSSWFWVAPRCVLNSAGTRTSLQVIPYLLPTRSAPALRRRHERSKNTVSNGEVNATVSVLDVGRACDHRATDSRHKTLSTGCRVVLKNNVVHVTTKDPRRGKTREEE